MLIEAAVEITPEVIKLADEHEYPLVIGDKALSRDDMLMAYAHAVSYYGLDSGPFNMWDLLGAVRKLYNEGGKIYRILVLDSEEGLNKDDLGTHWTFDTANIHGYMSLFDGDVYPDGELYLVTAETPPGNVSLYDDWMACIEENEIWVKDPKKLTDVRIEKWED